MKKILFLFFLGLSLHLSAQVPQGMGYQAVIRDDNGDLVVNHEVGMRISILQGSITGTVVYSETHNQNTNGNGLVTITIGQGTVVSGTFSAIQWHTGTYFLKTETDPNGGSSYTISGTHQLMTVPYAFYSNRAMIADTALYAPGGGGTDTSMWKKNGTNVYYKNGRVGVWIDTPTVPLEVYSTAYNKGAFTASAYVVDNAGDPPVALIRGLADGGSILEVSKATGAARNWGMIRIGTDGNLAQIFGQNGNIGINIAPPKRDLHVNDVMRLEPRSSAPSGPGKGDMYFDSSINKLRVYDGSIWQNCW